jgi:hypothetical protein
MARRDNSGNAHLRLKYLFERYLRDRTNNQVFGLWHLVRGSSKRVMLNRVLCPGALPTFNNIEVKGCYSNIEGTCKHCNNLSRLLIEEPEKELWFILI